MNFILHFAVISVLICNASADESSTALTKEDVARLFTSKAVTKHYDSGKKSAGKPKLEEKEGDIYITFPKVTIRIGTGGTFFTAKDAKEAKESLFSVILGDSLSPKIGLRAHVYGIEDGILLFTTSDGKFDIRIEPAALTPEMDVVGLGEEISGSYDQRTKPAEPQR